MLKVFKVMLDCKEIREHRDYKATQDYKVLLVPKDYKAQPELKA